MSVDAVAVPRAGMAHFQLFAEHENAPVRWRLLGGNNRELGRGVRLFRDEHACRAGIAELRGVLGALEPTVQRTAGSAWTWMLSLDGQVVATSGRRYDRLIRCRQGLEHFLSTVGDSVIGPGLMLTSARRWSAQAAAGAVREAPVRTPLARGRL